MEGGGWGTADAGSSGAVAASELPNAQRRALQLHERLWAALEGRSTAATPHSHSSSIIISSSSDGRIAYADVPWPPLECGDYLLALAALEQQQQQQPLQQQQQRQRRRAQRRAYARACLRWHPDKFVSRWGRLLLEAVAAAPAAGLTKTDITVASAATPAAKAPAAKP